MTTNNRAICYLRSSKDRSDVSIDAQRRDLHALALTKQLVVVDEFADAVESGKDDDRPAFQRLLHTLKQPTRGWDWVLVLDTSRVARRRLLAQMFEQDLKRRGVRLIYKNVPDTDPATEMLLKSVLQAMDEWHSLNSRQKGLAGMAENVRQGWRAGGRAPRGYSLEYHATGAVRDGAPVLKSTLVEDETTSGEVRAYLLLRAQGISRGVAIARLGLQWPPSSTHSMDWQALTYAGHTVWNMHAERESGKSVGGEKRRPRADWVIKRDTHKALISDAEAEAILAQQERAQQGRRVRDTPLLLTGLLVAPDNTSWHSDGCGHYRLGKGKKISATRLEQVVLEVVSASLCSDEAVRHMQRAIAGAAGGEPVDGRMLAGLEKRIATLTAQIGKTVDLAAQMDDPAPILRRVKDLEHQRSQLVDELNLKLAAQGQQRAAVVVDESQIRAALRRIVLKITECAADDDRRPAARQALAQAVERIELDPVSLTARVHFAVHTGDNLASPRGPELSPVETGKFCSEPFNAKLRRAA